MPEVYHGWWTPKQLKRAFGRFSAQRSSNDGASALQLEAFTHRATSGPHRHPLHLLRACELALELTGSAKHAAPASRPRKQRGVKAGLLDGCDKPTSKAVAAHVQCKSDFKSSSAHAGASETSRVCVLGGHVSISQHHRRLQCLAAAGSSYTWEASQTEVLPKGAGTAALLSQPAKSQKWSRDIRQKAKCGSTSPTQVTEAAATRELGCHLLRPSRCVLRTWTLWPSRPPTGRQRPVKPPLCKHWPQANTAMQRKETGTGTGHAWAAHAAWGRNHRQ